jgi:hypothetical protein
LWRLDRQAGIELVLSTIALRVKSMPSRYRSNRAALDVGLTSEDLPELDRWFLISFSTWIIDG